MCPMIILKKKMTISGSNNIAILRILNVAIYNVRTDGPFGTLQRLLFSFTRFIQKCVRRPLPNVD